MEGRVGRADGAAHGLGQRGFKVGVALILKQAAQLHHLGGDDGVGAVAAKVGIAVAGGPHGALVVEGGLQGELHAGLELILVVLANLDDIARKLVTHDHGVFMHVLGHALMLFAQHGALVGGHADAVGNHFRQNFIVRNFGQLKFLGTQILGAVQAQSLGFHG